MEISGIFFNNSAETPNRTVAYTGTAGSTATWPAGTEKVYVVCTTDAHVIVGESVTATTTNGAFVPANVPIVIRVPPGTAGAWRVSAIQVATGGNLHAKPLVS